VVLAKTCFSTCGEDKWGGEQHEEKGRASRVGTLGNEQFAAAGPRVEKIAKDPSPSASLQAGLAAWLGSTGAGGPTCRKWPQ